MTEDLTAVDFFRDRRLTDDPYPFYEALRNKCPVEPRGPLRRHDGDRLAGGRRRLQRRGDVLVLHLGDRSVSRVSRYRSEGDDVTELIEKHRDEIPFSDQLPTLDPPTHTNHRALLMRLITPKRLKENEDAMWQLADEILDDFLAPGEGEFIKGFAGPFTLRVIADLLGVPDGGSRRAHRAARARHPRRRGGQRREDDEQDAAGIPVRGVRDLRRGPAGRTPRRRADRTGDGEFPDGTMPEVGDVVRVATNVFSAGQETTVRLLSTALKVLGDRPDIQRRLRDDRSLLPNFIEECLRIESPVKGDFRLSRVPVTVGDEAIGAGATLMVINGAANRDPRRFEEPDTFDPERKNARQHLAFGRGIHSCPGAPLARAETRVGLERLLDRTTDIRISEEQARPGGRPQLPVHSDLHPAWSHRIASGVRFVAETGRS